MDLQAQLNKEMQRLNIREGHEHDNNVQVIGDTGLITFSVAGRGFWAKLTPTGKLKKGSIRIDNF